MDPITKENFSSVNIKSLALDKNKFGALTFDSAFPILKKLQNFFVELEDFDYKNLLTQNEINQVESYKTNFVNYLQRLSNFDLGKDPNFNKNVRDSFENEIKNFNDNVAIALRSLYSYLRQEADIKSRNGKDIQKDVISAQKEAKTLLNDLKNELENVRSKKANYEVISGQKVAGTFSAHFQKQAEIYSDKSADWLFIRNIFFYIMLGVVVLNIFLYTGLIFFDKNPDKYFTVQYGVAKIVFLSLLSYAIGFASKNYHIYAQLETVNIHRKNAANTMSDLLVANPDKPDVRAEVIRQASEAIFKHLPIGHITKTENQSGPIAEIIERVTPKIGG